MWLEFRRVLFRSSSASVRSIPFLSFLEPIFAWNVPLISLIFLKEISSLSHSIVFLYFFALITEEVFLSLLAKLQSMGSQRVGHDWATIACKGKITCSWYTVVYWYKLMYVYYLKCCAVRSHFRRVQLFAPVWTVAH